MKIVLNIEMPKSVPQAHKVPCLLEKVEEYILLVEDPNVNSKKEWFYLQRLYEMLQQRKKLSKEDEQILYWIEPLLIKYGHSHKAAKIDGSKMQRGKNHLNRLAGE